MKHIPIYHRHGLTYLFDIVDHTCDPDLEAVLLSICVSANDVRIKERVSNVLEFISNAPDITAQHRYTVF